MTLNSFIRPRDEEIPHLASTSSTSKAKPTGLRSVANTVKKAERVEGIIREEEHGRGARKMSHCHDEHAGHGHGDHHHHDHEHDHSDDITPAIQFSLYEQINFDEVTTLNESTRDSGKAIVKKTWAERLDTEPELASDADEQLLMTVP